MCHLKTVLWHSRTLICNLENSNMELYAIVHFTEQTEIKLLYLNESKQIKLLQFPVSVIVETPVKLQIFYAHSELMFTGTDFNKGFHRQAYAGDSHTALNSSTRLVQETSGQIFVNGWSLDNVIKMTIYKTKKLRKFTYMHGQNTLIHLICNFATFFDVKNCFY